MCINTKAVQELCKIEFPKHQILLKIGPVIEELSKEYEGKVNIGKVNVDNNPQISMDYGITSIPAILFVKGGKVVDKLVGAQPKGNFVKKIEAHK